MVPPAPSLARERIEEKAEQVTTILFSLMRLREMNWRGPGSYLIVYTTPRHF
jgi:hypothetical protein